jgi:hypothetical protein
MGLILIEHVLVSYMLFDRLSFWLWFKECKNDVLPPIGKTVISDRRE